METIYIVTLLVCLPLIGMGLRRARIAALQALRLGRTTELDEAMADSVRPVLRGHRDDPRAHRRLLLGFPAFLTRILRIYTPNHRRDEAAAIR